jgi:hypothetical protein
MAIATLAAVQSIRLGLPAYSSKALTDVKIAPELVGALVDEIQLWSILWRPEWQIGGLRGLSQFTLSGRRMPRLSRNSLPPLSK